MGAQPGQFGRPGGIPPQQAGMQPQGMGAPGEAARLVSHKFWNGAVERHISAHNKVWLGPLSLTLQTGWLAVAHF